MKVCAALLRAWLYYLRSIPRLLTGFHTPFRVASMLLFQPHRQPTLVRMRNGLSFWVRTGMDVWCLKETLLDRMYHKWGTEIESGWTVVDIGAGLGDFTIMVSRSLSRGHVFAFEPHPSSFELLERNVAMNGCGNATLVNCGILGEGPQAASLSSPSGEPLQASNVSGGHGGDLITTSCLSFVDAFSRYRIERVDLLKLDCEGAEFSILLESPDSAFNQVQRIVLEYHDFPGLDHRRLITRLEQLGYVVKRTANPVHEWLGFLYACRRHDGTEAELASARTSPRQPI